jgi:hypothetical protein
MSRRKPPSVTLAGMSNRHREVALVEVADPYEPGRRIVVAKNVSCHPAESMYARGYIDEAQRTAAVKVRALWEQAEIGASAAIDYSRTRVDGGQLGDPFSEAVYAARRALVGVRTAVGEGGYAILMPVMGEGHAIDQIARERPALSRGLKGKRAEGYLSGRIREALDDLVRHWGLVAFGGLRGRTVSERGMAVTGPQAEWEIGGRFGDLQPVTPKAAGKKQQKA